MPKKTTTKKKTTEATTVAAAEPMVTVLKTGTATKLSPRGDGQLTYQIGRMSDTVLLRISGNESSGRFSKEWVAVNAIRAALANIPKGAASFKAGILASAWTGRSSTHPGFGCACLKNEGVLLSDPDKKGMLKLTSPDALDAWEQTVLAMAVPKDAEQLPLHPPKPKPFFAKKSEGDGEGEGDAPAAEPATEPATETVADGEAGENPPEEEEA